MFQGNGERNHLIFKKDMDKWTIFVSGVAGFVGSYLTLQLLKMDANVIGLVI